MMYIIYTRSGQPYCGYRTSKYTESKYGIRFTDMTHADLGGTPATQFVPWTNIENIEEVWAIGEHAPAHVPSQRRVGA
jgi:hypothetical protein